MKEDKDWLEERETNPKATAGWLSSIFFWYSRKVFRKGSKRDLEEEDIPEPLEEHKASILGKKLTIIWAKEVDDASIAKKKPSFLRALRKAFSKELIHIGIAIGIAELIFKLVQPLFVGLFVSFFTNTHKRSLEESPKFLWRVFYYFSEREKQNITLEEAYFFACGIMLSNMMYIIIFHPYMMACLHLGMKIRVACTSLIYRKVLRLSLKALDSETTADALTLLSTDVLPFDLSLIFFHYIWIAPIQVACMLYFIYLETDVSSFIGSLAIFLAIPIQGWFGYKISKVQSTKVARTDRRVKHTNELLQAVQTLKMYTWERIFMDKINKLRREEIKSLNSVGFVRGQIMSFLIFTSRLAIFLTVLSYVLRGNALTAEKVFLLATYYQILNQTMTVFFPQNIALLADAYVSMKRIENFLKAEESDIGDLTVIDPLWVEKGKFRHHSSKGRILLAGEIPQIKIIDATATFDSLVCLKEVNLDVSNSSLTAIVGPVGAGKSSLLYLILGELEHRSGEVDVKGMISYAPQNPWLFAGTIRQNILFGGHFDRRKYYDVITACALQKDFRRLAYGDKTILGDRGVSLSGGQKARINLARAVYKEADIYLLDDPLSAVDAQVAKLLYEQCFTGYLKDKIVVLVTHQLQFMKTANNIIIMDRGSIQGSGTYESLKVSGLDYVNLITEQFPTVEESEKPVENILKNIFVTSLLTFSAFDKEGFKEGPHRSPELKSSGSIGFGVYKMYLKAAGYRSAFVAFTLFFLTQLVASSGDYFLSEWVALEDTNFLKKSYLNSAFSLNRESCIYIYATIIILTILISIFRSIFFFHTCMNASYNLHFSMLKSIVNSPISFFLENSVGRLLSRFSKDLSSVDEFLPFDLIDCLQIFLNLIGTVTVLITVEPIIFIPTGFMFLVFYIMRKSYLRTSRSIKRLEGISRSPLLGYLSATIPGLSTVRAFGTEAKLVEEFEKLQDIHSSVWFMFLYTSRAFGLWLDVVCTLFIGIIAFTFVVLFQYNVSSKIGSEVGLAITQAIGLSGLIQWGMRQTAELENEMTAVERISEYIKLKQETSNDDNIEKPPPDWPKLGTIEFIRTTMRYHPTADPVLKDLQIKINPQEKIGIVGRTGAGKSTLIQTLFRLSPYEGLILIDNLDIRGIGLVDLRRKISIIPQEPVLFSGTLRFNLDPFNEYTDDQVLRALLIVENRLALTLGKDCLDLIMHEGGSNMSVGQRQLICLARAVLRNNKILILDEVTANVDPKTDKFIQAAIRTKFAHCTVLVIAHRLHTIMESDKVLVMDSGSAVEFDHPYILLQNSEGAFSSLVAKTGPMAGVLKKIAKSNFEEKNQSES